MKSGQKRLKERREMVLKPAMYLAIELMTFDSCAAIKFIKTDATKHVGCLKVHKY